MEELADVLRQERHHLEVLLYRLTLTRLLLRDQKVRFLGWSSEEIQQARQQTREIDLLRAAHVQLLEVRGSGGQPPTLRQMASLAGDPWAGILRDHHDALGELVAEIEVVAHATGEAARKAIRGLADDAQTRSTKAPRGGKVPARNQKTSPVEPQPVVPRPALSAWRAAPFSDELLPDDEDLTLLAKEGAYERVLAASGKLQIPSLLAFLR
jgi:hypothetical protein